LHGDLKKRRGGKRAARRVEHPVESPVRLLRVSSPLKGRVALATGASSGIGRAIALALASSGAAVFLVGRDLANLESTARTARARTDRVWVCPTDLRLESEIRKLAERVKDEAGRLDILALAAGVYARASLVESAIGQLDDLYHVNVRAPYLLTQCLMPVLRSHRGQIVFVNSSSGVQARAKVGQFAATQYALRGMANALREEVNPFGVRVLNIFPGRTATPRMRALFAAEGKRYRPEALLQPEDVAAMIVQALSLPRTAEVTEIHMRPMLRSSSRGT
jgi:NADP-dependent 3-hydroxy acid dehydrogenase YdfG